MFGSITGRLTVHKNSFPILTFPKQYREILLPQNDWFVVFDMNLKFNRYSESFRLINVSEEYYNCNCFSITDNKIEYIIRLNNKNIVAYSEIDCCKWWYD